MAIKISLISSFSLEKNLMNQKNIYFFLSSLLKYIGWNITHVNLLIFLLGILFSFIIFFFLNLLRENLNNNIRQNIEKNKKIKEINIELNENKSNKHIKYIDRKSIFKTINLNDKKKKN